MREFSRLKQWIINHHRVHDAARLRAILGLVRLPLSAVAALHVHHWVHQKTAQLATAQHAVLRNLTALKAQSHARLRAGFIPLTTARARRSNQAPAHLVVAAAQVRLAIVLLAATSLAQALRAVVNQILNQTHVVKAFHLAQKSQALAAQAVAVRALVHLADQAEVVHLLDRAEVLAVRLAEEAVAIKVVHPAAAGQVWVNTSTHQNLLIRQ